MRLGQRDVDVVPHVNTTGQEIEYVNTVRCSTSLRTLL